MPCRKHITVKNGIIIFLFSLFLCIPKPGETQEQSLFKDLGIYGGQITSIAQNPAAPQVMYAGSWGGDGLFKSTDGGDTWLAIPQDEPSWFRNQEVYDIEIDPSDPDTIWVANNHYVDVSRDGGDTWRTFFFADDEDRFCYSVAVDPQDSDTVYVGTGGELNTDEYGEIFITRDGGDSWDKQYFNSETLVWNNFWQLKFNPNRPGELWAANRKSYLSPEGIVVVHAPDKDGIWGWWYWSMALEPSDNKFYSFGYIDEVLIHPVNPYLIFLSSGEGIARKVDGSALYTDDKEENPSYWYWTDIYDACRAMCIPPAEPSTVYAGLYRSVAVSTDEGVTWQTEGKDAPSEFLTLEPHPTDPATLYAGSLNQGVLKSQDRADTWASINTGIRANTVYDSAVDPNNQERVVCGTLAGIFLKESATADWTKIHTSCSEAVTFDPARPGTIYAGFDWRIGKSTDSGATWSYVDTPDQDYSNEITSIAIDAAGGAVFAAVGFSSGKKGQLLKIADTGGAFSDATLVSVVLETPVPLNAVAISPHDPSLMLAVSGSFYAPAAPGGLYISRDGGQTWRKKPLITNYTLNCIAFDPSDPAAIYVGAGASDGSYGGVLKSTTAGLTWRKKEGGLPPNLAVMDMQVTSDGHKAYAVLYKGYYEPQDTLGGTYVSLDGGDYWTRLGLSSYRMYDVSLAETPATAGTSARLKSTEPMQAGSGITYTVYVGTASGLMNEDPSTIAGTGIISGMVTDTDGRPLTDVRLRSSAGTGSQSEQGVYLLVCPAGQHTIEAQAAGYTQIGANTLYVNAGGSSEFNIMMTPSNGDNNGTCLSSRLLNDTPDNGYLKPLRAFRDGVLKKTPLGRTIIARYYGIGAELLPVIRSHARLKRSCVRLIKKSVGVIRAQNGRPLALPPGFMDEASSFLFELEKNAPPQIQGTIRRLRCDMRRLKPEQLRVNPAP